ncbi:P-loop containing nucleoside triphosphate hydrolase protein [Blastocladiella britannica]|nr:P-loop containing nucleoside triphosphate hydrolase protein [Blastocladiella britannica]
MGRRPFHIPTWRSNRNLQSKKMNGDAIHLDFGMINNENAGPVAQPRRKMPVLSSSRTKKPTKAVSTAPIVRARAKPGATAAAAAATKLPTAHRKMLPLVVRAQSRIIDAIRTHQASLERQDDNAMDPDATMDVDEPPFAADKEWDVLEQPISVVLRVRPLLDIERERGLYEGAKVTDGNSVVYHPIHSLFCDLTLEAHSFVNVDASFGPKDSAERIYERTAKRLLPFIADQHGLATIMSFGQTGAGKTHTTRAVHAQLPHDLFTQYGATHRVSVAYLEVFGDLVTDLLREMPSGGLVVGKDDDEKNPMAAIMAAAGPPLKVRCLPTGTSVMGANVVQATSPDDVTRAITLGAERRRTRATFKNSGSSRSHGVLVIQLRSRADAVTMADVSDNEQSSRLDVGAGTLLIVDLAGSERQGDQKKHDAVQLAETRATNKSLATLKACMRGRQALHERNSVTGPGATGAPHIHVPFRASKLTMLLREALDPTATTPSRTVVLGHLAPALADSEHSINTARWVSQLKPSAGHGSAEAIRQQEEDRASSPSPATLIDGHPAAWTYRKLCNSMRSWSHGTAHLEDVLMYHDTSSDAIRNRMLTCGMVRDPTWTKDEWAAHFLEMTTSVITGEHTLVCDVARSPVWLELYRMPLREWSEKVVASARNRGILAPAATRAAVAAQDNWPEVVAVKVGARRAWEMYREAVAVGHTLGDGASGRNRAGAEQVEVVLVAN